MKLLITVLSLFFSLTVFSQDSAVVKVPVGVASGISSTSAIGDVSAKLSNSDTATMLSHYLTGLIQVPTKVNISDTATMLANYKSGLIAGNAGKLNKTDTSAMLANYLTGIIAIGGKVNISDTAAMLANYKASMIASAAGKLNKTDTAAMLANYLTGIIGVPVRVKYTDTSGMLANYLTGIIAGAAKQTALSGTGLVSFSGTTPSYNTTSSAISTIISDEQGSGSLVFATTPTLTTPVLGVATATSINKVAITAPATNATLTLAQGSTLATAGAFSNTITTTGTTTVTFPTTGVIYSNAAATISSASLAGALAAETGTGNPVFGTSPTFTTNIILPTGSTSQVPVTWVSGTLKTTAAAASSEYNGSFYDTKASGLRYGMGGVIANFTSDVANVTTTETDMFTYTTPASTLANTGEQLVGDFQLKWTSVTATQQIKVYYAGSAIWSSVSGAPGLATSFSIKVRIIRTGTTTARAMIELVGYPSWGFDGSQSLDITGITFTNTNILKVTATSSGSGAASADMTAKFGSVYWYPAAAN